MRLVAVPGTAPDSLTTDCQDPAACAGGGQGEVCQMETKPWKPPLRSHPLPERPRPNLLINRVLKCSKMKLYWWFEAPHLNRNVAGTAVHSDGIFSKHQAVFSDQDARLHGSADRNHLIRGDGVQQLHVWEQIPDHLLQLWDTSWSST